MARTARLSLLVGLAGLLLLCAGAGGQPDVYEPNALYAECGRSCRNASSCETTEIETTEINLLCRCDSECRRYGDCCANANASSCYGAQTQQSIASTYAEEERKLDGLLQCSSVHLDPRTMPDWMESFWMVSACPRDWLAGRDDPLLLNIEENCRSGNNILPPVTDPQSELVYRNEYCAVCHEVANILPWGYRFECTPWLRDMVSAGLQLTSEIIKRECIACGFRAPQTVPVSARACLHDSLLSTECLGREELENLTGIPIEEERYQDIVGQCETGPISPVRDKFSHNFDGVPFRNQYCALCNGVIVAFEELTCVDPYTARDTTDHCGETAANLMPERPTTPLAPTTAAPTTAAPTTADPTTAAPTTADPTTADPTTAAPTTADPTTAAPTTADPTTADPTTAAPTIEPPDPKNFNITESTIIPFEPPMPTFEPRPTFKPRPTFAAEDSVLAFAPPAPEQPAPEQPAPPFTVFLDVNGDSQVVTTKTTTVNIPTSCPDGEVFNPITQSCRPTICPEGFATQRASCKIVQNITFLESGNATVNDSCDGALIPLEEDEFELLGNESLLFQDEIFDIFGYTNSSPIICTNLTQNGTFESNVTVFFYSYPAVFSFLTYVGCTLSVIGCTFVLLTYSLFRELRTLPGQILMNLAATILATSVFLLVGIPLFALGEREELCHTSAILLHWIVLCQFSWMAVMSFELARTLCRALNLQPVQNKKVLKKIFLLYMLIGWGLPTIITGVSVLVNYTTDYIRYGVDGFCWIGHTNSFYIAFVVPVALGIVFNGISFTVSVSMLYRASRTQSKLKKQNNTSYLRVYLSIFSITGLTWTFGFVAILARTNWAWYLFIILTSTQGFTICLAFLFTQKVVSLYKQFLWPKISKTFTFGSTSKQHTQDTSVGIRYTKKSENISTVSHEFTPGGGNPHANTSSANGVAVRYGKKVGGEENASEHIALEMDNVHTQEAETGKQKP